MSNEKIIRNQAKKSLEGNWVSAVSGFFVVLSVIFAVDVFYSLLAYSFGVMNGETVRKGTEPVLIVILCVSFLAGLALSPVKNGYNKLCYNLANGQGEGMRDVFYFFSGINLYFKALRFNILIALKVLLYVALGAIPYIVCRIGEEIVFRFFINATITSGQIMDAVEAALIVLGILFALYKSIRLFITEFLFVDCESVNVFGISAIIAKKHIGDINKLVFSFLLWILLCVFVLPALYVIPYFITSMATSSKWLIKMYKDGKTV